MREIRRKQNVMIKPTHNCNMNCDYCFVKNLTKQYREQKMSLDTLNDTFRVLSNSAEEVDIIWHGGEPTLAGTQFYKDAIELSYIYSDRTRFTHSMQSNGLLLNDDWIDLVKNYGIDISVSFDGLFQDIRQEGTKEILERNLLKFKEEVGHVGCLSIITEDSYKGMIDNYKYFKDLGINVAFNYGINGKYDNYENYKGIPLHDYMKEYIKYFKFWINDRNGFNERSCTSPVERIFGLNQGTCNTSDCRYHWLNVNPDGTTTPCNRYFSNELGMGNIAEVETVDDLYNKEGYVRFCDLAEVRLQRDCAECSYIEYCNGGCNSNHLMNTGSISTVDISYCERFKLEFTQVYKILNNIDIYSNSNLNLHFLRILGEGVYTPNEIRDFLARIGINSSRVEFDENDLINCNNFKLFRVFNPIRENKCGHSDYYKREKMTNKELLGIASNDKFKQERFKELSEIYEKRKEDVFKLVGGVE